MNAFPFFHESKLGQNASQTDTSINSVWGEGSDSERKVQIWFQKLQIFKIEKVEIHVQLSKTQLTMFIRWGPILFHINARSDVARVILQKLIELGYETLPDPPYFSFLFHPLAITSSSIFTLLNVIRLSIQKENY